MPGRNIMQVKTLQTPFGLILQRLDPLDAVDMVDQLSQHRRLITRACANFQYRVWFADQQLSPSSEPLYRAERWSDRSRLATPYSPTPDGQRLHQQMLPGARWPLLPTPARHESPLTDQLSNQRWYAMVTQAHTVGF